MEFLATAIVLQLMLAFHSGSASEEKKVGHWGQWGPMSPCSVTCGSGTMKMERVWIPAPDDPPTDQPWTSTQFFACTDKTYPDCPRDGAWSGWGAWSGCTKACGGGRRERHRDCRGQMYGGKACEGEKYDKEDCNREPCPALPRNFDMSQCKEKANFTCVSQKMCIALTHKCDGTVQCHDGSDEENCPRYLSGWGNVRYDLSRGRNGASPLTLKPKATMVMVFLLSVIFMPAQL